MIMSKYRLYFEIAMVLISFLWEWERNVRLSHFSGFFQTHDQIKTVCILEGVSIRDFIPLELPFEFLAKIYF